MTTSSRTGEMNSGMRELVEVAFGLSAWMGEARPIDERYFARRVDELCGEASKAERVLGWRPRSRSTGWSG